MSRRGHGRSSSRVVQYRLHSPTGTLDDSLAETLLAAARAAGIVTNYDAGRGHDLWWEGPPGAAMRAFRDEMNARCGDGATRP